MNMRRVSAVLAMSVCSVFAAPIPRHALRMDGALTERSARAPREIGDAYTALQMKQAGIPQAAGLYLANEYKTAHNGVTHLTYRQRFQGLDIYGMEWRVNIDAEGRIVNAGGQLFNAPAGAPASSARLAEAAQVALSGVNPVLARETELRRSGMTSRAQARFVGGGQSEVIGEPVWFPVRGALQAAWHMIVTDEDGITSHDVIVDGEGERLLAKQPITMFQSAPKGAVFTGISPQPPVQIGVQSNAEPPYVERVVVPFAGSATASPKGWVTGAETSGNNTITGANPAGTRFLTTPLTARAVNGDFQFPLVLGPEAPVTTAFTDAVTTNLFYWTNRTHDLFYEIGFDEAAGNYQVQNFTGIGQGGDPMLAYAQYGAQALSGTAALNNAFFTTRNRADGDFGMIAMYLTSNGGVWADGSLASDVIIHEYSHGVTSRLIPTMNATFQGGAMNEALSDFWSLEFLTPDSAPVDGVYPVAEYWGRGFGSGLRNRPYTTNMEVNPLTYADLGHSWYYSEIHEDGVIWVQALWEVRANLIRQFGAAEGRRRLRRIVLDGMKMSPPAPSMVDLRDAILLAERVDYRGESQTQIWEAFARRGLGVLAYSPGWNTIQVSASFDKPSNTGVIGVQTETPGIGEPLRINVYDGNYTSETLKVDVTASSGDVETVVLSKDGLAYSGTLFTTSAGPAVKGSGSLSLIRGDAITIYYNDQNTGGGTKLVEKTVLAINGYTQVFNTAPTFTFPGETATNLRASPGTSSGLRQTLPFDFPFYDKKYREVRIFPEGYIQFDAGFFPTCFDDTGLASMTAIAPMAMWMRTNGITQPNENIYTSRGPNSFTIRWAGETIPIVNAPPFAPGAEPVNFALTLQENGEIRFTYGTGNQNLINSPPGCPTTTPMVGISRGIGNGALLHVYGRDRVTFKDAPGLAFFPPFGNSKNPQVRIESPLQDDTVKGVLTVKGIIYDEDTFVSAASILIDGVFQGNAARGLSRTDICTTEKLPGCPSIGFLQNLNVKGLGLQPGTHTFQIRAVNAKGGFQDYPASPISFTIEDGEGPLPVGVIETAKDGDVWKGAVTLRGYAYAKASRVSAVDLIIDGVGYGRTAYGLGRPDICGGEAAGASNCPGIGWLTSINTAATAPALRNGEHQLQLRITEDNGRISYQPETPITVTVDNLVNSGPVGVVTEPTNLQRVSGVITVSGYAYDPDGRITTAVLVIDEFSRGALRYGTARPEVCATLKDVTACPNIGFDGTYDTKLLPNGPHRLGVGLIDNGGKSLLIPGITAGGMNIIVDNP